MENQHVPECLACQLGLVTFPEAMEFEHSLIRLRYEEKIGDILLIFEHPPTVTLGRSGKVANILVPLEELQSRGIEYFESDRAGDATFNCPGQLVIHPIMDLRKRKGILRGYVTDLEETIIRVLGEYKIGAGRWAEHHGIWVNEKQIGAIGLRINRGISMHGLSLNVNPDLTDFSVINLCGLPGKSATSMENELGHAIAKSEVSQKIESSFSSVFNVGLKRITKEQLARVCFTTQGSEVSALCRS
jgi:lipoate-protein ligase B